MTKARRLSLAASIASAAMLLAMSGQALAVQKTISARVGPVPLPSVPAQVCIDGDCQNTPNLQSVALEVSATFDADLGTPPTLNPGTCPAGQTGAVLVITTGTTSATVDGVVTATLPDGRTMSIPVGPITIGANETVTISACTTADAPALPGVGVPQL